MNDTASVIAVGDELLSGSIVDSNSRFLGEFLTKRGFTVRKMLSISDDVSEIESALDILLPESSLVVITGGLGPTTDDVTRDAVSRFCSRELEIDDKSYERLSLFYEKRHLRMGEGSRRQAMFPKGSLVLKNPVGTADAFVMAPGGESKFVVCLPGVPSEMRFVVEHSVSTWLAESFSDLCCKQIETIKIIGRSESQVGSLIEESGLPNGIAVSYRVACPELIVTLRLSDCSVSQREERELLSEAVSKAIAAVGEQCVFTRDPGESIQGVVSGLFLERDLTLSVAESCTGGLLSHMLVSIPGASGFFLSSVVSYSNASKEVFLGVDSRRLEVRGAVSGEIAEDMARGVRMRTGADIGLSVTGIAGPGGGTEEKPPGTFYVGLSSADSDSAFYFFRPTERNRFRKQAAGLALDLLRRHLLHIPIC